MNILKSIAKLTGNASDHLDSLLTSDQAASASKNEQAIRHRYQVMFHRLKADGLIKESVKDNKPFLRLTPSGDIKLKMLQQEIDNRLRVPEYIQPAGKTVIIVSFDIPERERIKRAWLRSVLKNLGMRMIHQSTWFGRGKLPKEFLDDLYRLRLAEYVEIFEVTKAGTLTHVI